MANLASSLGRIGLVGALAFELASVVAVVHARTLRLWLPGCVMFHTVLFAFTGFWFLSWVVLEIALIVVLTRGSLAPWISQNSTAARALVAVAAVVVAGATIFHPPTLTWFDSPASYGYRMVATGESGEIYEVPPSAFAPVEQEVAFFTFVLGPTAPAVGAYGSALSKGRLRDLEAVESFADLEALELASPANRRLIGQLFIQRFIDSANSSGPAWWHALSPRDHFWTGAQGRQFDFDEKIERLDVYVVRSLHRGGDPERQAELVASFTLDANGSAQLQESGGDSS
jgi:hypothetical protein